MDYMRISGAEPSSVILSQTCNIKYTVSHPQKSVHNNRFFGIGEMAFYMA